MVCFLRHSCGSLALPLTVSVGSVFRDSLLDHCNCARCLSPRGSARLTMSTGPPTGTRCWPLLGVQPGMWMCTCPFPSDPHPAPLRRDSLLASLLDSVRAAGNVDVHVRSTPTPRGHRLGPLYAPVDEEVESMHLK